MDGRICPVCRKEASGTVCQSCGTDLELFNQVNAKVRELLNQGMAAMQAKSYLNALQLLEQGLKLNPKDSALLLMAGLCHYSLGDLQQADECWRKSQNSLASEYRYKTEAEREAFERVTASYNKALNLMQSGKAQQAVGLLRPALKTGPQYLPALELLALAYYQQKKYHRCWRVIGRIQAVTADAPVLMKLVPDLVKQIAKLRLVYGAAVLLVATGVLGYLSFQSTAAKVPAPLSVKPAGREKPERHLVVDRELLQSTANQLAKKGDYVASADILLALNSQTDNAAATGLNPEESLILAKAAARYYFSGMRYLRRKQYSEAAVAFSTSLRYPVRSYVFDDALYYQAVVRERLGIADRAVVLYRKLLDEVPASNYCRSAVIRWAKLANSHHELREEFRNAIDAYPEYQKLMQNQVKSWGD